MKTTFIFSLCISSFVVAQQDRKVLATSGRVAKNLTPSLFQNRRIEYTLGEPITFTTLANGKRINSGFIQPDANKPILNPNGGASAAEDKKSLSALNKEKEALGCQKNKWD